MSTVDDASATVAVIIRTKDRNLLLRRAIKSVLSQTYSDIRLCIVNDGGARDPVERLVSEYSERAAHPIQLIHNEVSRGVSGAANAGIAATSSTYLALHDDDDTWHPQFVERTVGCLTETGEFGVMTRTEVVFETVDDNVITTDRRELLASDLHEVSLMQMLCRNANPPISFLYRREAHAEIGMYDESLTVLEDWDFYLRFLTKHDIAFIDGEPLAFWHHREGSSGSMSNTVVSGSSDHDRFNRIIRDRYIRQALDSPGQPGGLLFLAELEHRSELQNGLRFEDMRERIADMLATLGHLRVMADGNQEHLNALSGRIDYLNDLQARRLTAHIERVERNLDRLEHKLDRIEGIITLTIPREKLKGFARRSLGKLHR